METSVLGHWLLYHKATQSKIAEAPSRVGRSLLLLNQIREGMFSCGFVTSDFAFAELYQVLRDNIVANKILKAAHSLVYFPELKSQFALSKEEIKDMRTYLDEFYSVLDELKIRAYIMKMDMRRARKFITDLNLSTPDAIHLAWAISKPPYDYFVTDDSDFLAIRGRVQKPRIVKPSGVHTCKELHA